MPLANHYLQSGRRIRIGIVAFAALAVAAYAFSTTAHRFAPFGLLISLMFVSGAVNLAICWLSLKRGEFGEDRVAKELQKLPEGYTIERNVVIPGAKIGDLDIVVTGPRQTIVLEVKNWSNPVVCEGDCWWIKRSNGSLRRVKSPSLQVKRAAKALKTQRGGLESVESLVVMTGGARMSIKTPTVPVVSLKAMNAHIVAAGTMNERREIA